MLGAVGREAPSVVEAGCLEGDMAPHPKISREGEGPGPPTACALFGGGGAGARAVTLVRLVEAEATAEAGEAVGHATFGSWGTVEAEAAGAAAPAHNEAGLALLGAAAEEERAAVEGAAVEGEAAEGWGS